MVRAWAVLRTALPSGDDEGTVSKLVRCLGPGEVRGLPAFDSLQTSFQYFDSRSTISVQGTEYDEETERHHSLLGGHDTHERVVLSPHHGSLYMVRGTAVV